MVKGFLEVTLCGWSFSGLWVEMGLLGNRSEEGIKSKIKIKCQARQLLGWENGDSESGGSELGS